MTSGAFGLAFGGENLRKYACFGLVRVTPTLSTFVSVSRDISVTSPFPRPRVTWCGRVPCRLLAQRLEKMREREKTFPRHYQDFPSNSQGGVEMEGILGLVWEVSNKWRTCSVYEIGGIPNTCPTGQNAQRQFQLKQFS